MSGSDIAFMVCSIQMLLGAYAVVANIFSKWWECILYFLFIIATYTVIVLPELV